MKTFAHTFLAAGLGLAIFTWGVAAAAPPGPESPANPGKAIEPAPTTPPVVSPQSPAPQNPTLQNPRLQTAPAQPQTPPQATVPDPNARTPIVTKDGDRTNVHIENPRTGQTLFQGSFDGAWRQRLRDERGDYRWQNFRGADVGLWFNRGGQGLVISDVATTGAIAQFGFREGDRIVSVNGQPVTREADFSRYLFAPENRAGRVNVIILRDGREQTIAVEPRLFMEEFTGYQPSGLDRLGLMIDERASDRVVVTRVAPYSPAYYAGLRTGDVIVSFRGQPVRDPGGFVRLFDRLEPGNIAVEVNRNNKARNLELEIEADRQTVLKPEVNGATTLPAERREERRDERRDERKDRIENRDTAPPRTVDIDASTPKK